MNLISFQQRTLLAAIALAAAASAQAQGGPHRQMMEGAGPRMMWESEDSCPMSGGPYLHGYPWRMNLSEAQRAEAEKIFDRARTRIRAQRDQRLAAQTRLREALEAPKRKREDIMNAWREIEQFRLREFEANLDAQLEFDKLQGK